MANTVPAPELQSRLRELTALTAAHFAHEEREMRRTGYDHFDWHRRQHRTAKATAAKFAKRVLQGDPQAAAEMAVYLQSWLRDHIGIADRMLDAHLRNHQRAQAL